jgi:hypothetical protein
MYIRDGIVYGGEPKQPLKVEQVKALSDMMLLLLFNNGEQRLFDATVLDGPAFEPLYDEKMMSEYIAIIKKRLCVSDKEFDEIMAAPAHQHTEYKTDRISVVVRKLVNLL